VSEQSRERLSALLHEDPVDLGLACLLVAAEFDEDLAAPGGTDPWLAALDALAAHVPAVGDPADRLRTALSGYGGLPSNEADYADLRSSLLHEVLRRRRGLPILLSVVWIEVARRAGVPCHGVGLPGHFVVQLGAGGPLVDPWAGGLPFSLRPGDAEHVRAWSVEETLTRVLANVRAWADRPERLPQRLRAVELGLLLPTRSLALRRERGLLRVRLGDPLGGAADLEAWADVVEGLDAPAAEEARRAARGARATLN
jgi:regulator of sirC expression with transglutaminase-like and TPR domain